MTRIPRLARVALLVTLLAALPVAAHEGHDHGAPAPMPADANLVVRSASNESYELVLKYPGGTGQSSAAMRVYLSDYATNAPIRDANVALRATSPRAVSANALPISPGIYEADFPFGQSGRYTMILTVGGTTPSEFAFQDLPLGMAAAAAAPAGAAAQPGMNRWWIGGLLAALVVILAVLLARRRRAGPVSRSAMVLALLGAGLATWQGARAHEGHSHGGEQPAATGPALAGQARHMPKESQFFLGVRTMVTRMESLRSRIRAIGHVEAESGALARIEAPRDGRLDAGGRRLKVGDRVRAGQMIASLLTIDALPIRAPISGLVAEVHFAPGQWVQAGAVLAVILDERQVRVELPLFGENLTQALRARSATVTASSLPGVQFPAQVRGLAPTAPEPTGGQPGEPAAGTPIPPVLLSVANRGGLLRPGMLVEASLELPGAEEMIAVPESAVIQQEGGATVFVHTAPEVFEPRSVRVAGRYVDRLGIVGEIRPGDRVVVEGASSLVSAPPVTTAPAAAGGGH